MKTIFEQGLAREKEIVKETATLNAVKEDKKLEIYRNLRGKKVKLGKKIHYLPESVELQISKDDDGKLHFPVLLLYDEFM